MKTKFLTILLFLFPVMLFAQNYEKDGDVCFEKGEYQEAEKKYKAAALLSGESSVLEQKQKNSSICFDLLTKAKDAEQNEMYSNAADFYEKLYSIHNLSKYQEKAEDYRTKVAQLQKEKEKQEIDELYQKGLEYYEQEKRGWAYDEFKVAAEKGHVNSMYYCGKCFEETGDDKYYYSNDYYETALEWYKKAADHGHVDAQCKVGEFYYEGKGVRRDTSLGLEWYEKAAENNQKDALLFIVEGLSNGTLNGNEAKWYKKAAEAGIYLGEYHLAICYENGKNGVTKDAKKALEYYRSAKEKTEQLYWDNDNDWPNNTVSEVWKMSDKKVKELTTIVSKQDKKEQAKQKADDYFNQKQYRSAITLYQEALGSNNNTDKDVLYKLGYCYEQTSQNKQAVDNYMAAAIKDHKDAAYQLGLCYEHGKGIAVDYDQAIDWYVKAEKLGHKEAQKAAKKLKETVSQIKNIADYKSKGQSYFNSSKYNESLQWYEKAVALGDVESIYWVAESYLKLKQASKAIDWYRKAAEKNNQEAMLRLGECYGNGTGVPLNYAESTKWYRLAADQGNAAAQYQLGYNFENEIGGTKDMVAAYNWYIKAANNGYSKAYYQLGECYSKGIGCQKNAAEAAKWYEKAAVDGNVKAQNKIGNCYNYGTGVRKNTSTAYKWYNQAAKNGHSAAKVRVTQKDYFDIWGNWELTWFGVNGSLGTGYELGISAMRVRYMWFQLNLLDFKLSDRFSNIKEYGSTEPYIFYQPSLNVLFPVYDSGAVYLGMGPSWDIYMQEFDCKLKVEAGFRFNYGNSASSDVFLRYDGYTFSIGGSIQWSTFF